MSTDELLRRIQERGLRLVWDTAAGKPALQGDRRLVTAALLAVLKWHREAIVAKLAPADPGTCCPMCRRPVDAKRICWKCHDRPCSVCGQQTGSAFILMCIRCGNNDQ